MNTELQVGDIREFTFTKDKKYIIEEILDNPQISMLWTWTSGICPHCKNKIDRTVNHTFYRIEILVDETKKEKTTKADIIIVGDTLDNRKMIIPVSEDAFNQVLAKSEKFKYLLEDVK